MDRPTPAGDHGLLAPERLDRPFADPLVARLFPPLATGVRNLPGSVAAAVEITHADGGRRLAAYSTGSTEAGLTLKGRFGVIELDAKGRLRGLLLVQGNELRRDGLQLKTDRDVSLSVTFDAGRAQLVSSPRIGFETLEGVRLYRTGQSAIVSMTISASVSPTGEEIQRSLMLSAQAKEGPVPVDVEW